MTKIPPEVLIYIQTVKTYLKNNTEAKDYFIGESDEELFFDHLSEISQKNFESNGPESFERKRHHKFHEKLQKSSFEKNF